MCWSTTEAFHDLYQKSKLAQQQFLSQLIKVEVDTIGLYPENGGRDFGGEQLLEISSLKVEPGSGELLIPIDYCYDPCGREKIECLFSLNPCNIQNIKTLLTLI